MIPTLKHKKSLSDKNNKQMNQDSFCSVEELEKLVAEDPTELQRLVFEIYPKCARYARDHFGCVVKLSSFVTIEGHLSIYLLIYPESSTKHVCMSVSTIEALGLNDTLQWVHVTAAQALPLPYAWCAWCLEHHRQMSCLPVLW